MSKIILFGKSKRRTQKTFHLTRAFKECGNEVLWLKPSQIKRRQKNERDNWILGQVLAFKPDFIFIFSKDIPLSVLQKISEMGIKTILYYVDMADEISDDYIQRGKLVDYFLATNKGKLVDYKKAGIVNPVYFIDACDRYDHYLRKPFLPLWKSDIASYLSDNILIYNTYSIFYGQADNQTVLDGR